MSRVALVDRNYLVDNVIRASIETAKELYGEGYIFVELKEDERCDFGSIYYPKNPPFHRFVSPSDGASEVTDWDGFRVALFSNSGYVRLSSISKNLPYSVPFSSALWQMGSRPELVSEVGAYWNQMVKKGTLSDSEIESINRLCKIYRTPFALDSNGLFSIGR